MPEFMAADSHLLPLKKPAFACWVLPGRNWRPGGLRRKPLLINGLVVRGELTGLRLRLTITANENKTRQR